VEREHGNYNEKLVAMLFLYVIIEKRYTLYYLSKSPQVRASAASRVVKIFQNLKWRQASPFLEPILLRSYEAELCNKG
jgi:hypothetical protein